MKKCPFCAEEIQDEAVKCRYCKEFLTQGEEFSKGKPEWYFKKSSLIVGFLFLGPFILPLVWFNPHYSSQKKVAFTVVILVMSAVLLKTVIIAFESISQYYDIIQQSGIF